MASRHSISRKSGSRLKWWCASAEEGSIGYGNLAAAATSGLEKPTRRTFRGTDSIKPPPKSPRVKTRERAGGEAQHILERHSKSGIAPVSKR